MLPTPMTDPQPQVATPPTPPAVPEAPVAVGTPSLPATTDIGALRGRQRELSNQLESVTGRREQAFKDLQNTPAGPARQAVERRLVTLDDRITSIEQEIKVNGEMLANAPVLSSTAAQTHRYGPFSSGQLTGITIVSIVMVWAPLAFAAARTMLRRWAHPRPAPQVLESAARLERMEQAIDAVAIEVERISEGQRFVTQTLAKRDAAALGVGQAPAEPIRVGDAQSVARGTL